MPRSCFACSVKKGRGSVIQVSTYRGYARIQKLLEQEKGAEKVVGRRGESKIHSTAVYNHLPVDAIYYGTVTFMLVADGKPRLADFF